MDNVVPISPPRKPAERKKRAPLQQFKHVDTVLFEHQMRVCEATAVARMLRFMLQGPPAFGGFTSDHIETMEYASSAIIRLLKQVDGLGSFEDLVQQDEDTRNPPEHS